MHTPRNITASDIAGLGELLNRVFRSDNSVFDQDVLTDFPLVFVPENYANCRVIELDHRIVSHAAIFRCETIIDDVSLLTAVIILVATDSCNRKQGLAATLMRDLQRTMHEESYDLGVLWTGVPDFYRKLGWQVVTPRGWMLDDLRSKCDVVMKLARSAESIGTIVPFEEARHLEEIQSLHDRERIRIARSREEYAALLLLPKMTVWVLERAAQVAAYVVVGQTINKPGVIEYGGSTDDILALIAHALANQQLDRALPLLIYHPREDLARRFLDVGEPLAPLECSKGRGYEMVYLVDPDRLSLASLEDLFVGGLDFT